MTNCWSGFTSNLTMMYTTENQINQDIKNLNSGSISYETYQSDMNQISNTLSNAQSILNTGAFSVFVTQVQNACNQISTTASIIDPSTGLPVSVNFAIDFASFTITPTYQQLCEGGSWMPSWMPGMNQTGTIDGSDQDTWGDLMNEMWTNNDSASFDYTLPNGDDVEATVNCDANGNFSVTFNFSASDVGQFITVNSVNTSSLQSVMSQWN